MKNEDITVFKESVDCWIKDLQKKFANFDDIPCTVSENIDNTQHNYELISEMKSQISELKYEIEMMRLVQTMMLKKEVENLN